ncbi:hypothetical protein ASG01_08620 [Chryseobacterium sp. Leaf180]|uniref:hypothetical protein n=1 Tax=Chryseobacterium sp. Leaf180 TaxID=1736289 RepID=UPI0006F6F550|nr:hypothetical protein [Chryseobacterium sp. Leaf180]KQR93251.1 hypothetical protein ASG01_08620 [Chryseobacterium sp. Leaf180]
MNPFKSIRHTTVRIYFSSFSNITNKINIFTAVVFIIIRLVMAKTGKAPLLDNMQFSGDYNMKRFLNIGRMKT